MKNLIIKLDRVVLNVVSTYVRRWIKRKEYKRHKIDFMIRVEWFQFAALIVWALVLPVGMYLKAGNVFAASLHGVMWSLLAVMEYVGIQFTIHRLKPLHDILFSLRENPTVYEMEKESCERAFVEGRRRRLETNALVLGFTFAMFVTFSAVLAHGDPAYFAWQYLLANAIVFSLKRYIFHVFDFEPPKSKKKVSEVISELVQRLWGELIGGLVPQPAFAGVRITNKR